MMELQHTGVPRKALAGRKVGDLKTSQPLKRTAIKPKRLPVEEDPPGRRC
jgi:hypothetical protein